MPCRDSRDDEDNVRNALLVSEYGRKIDNLTDMLCEVCSTIEFEKLSQRVRGWYSRHLDADRKRLMTTLDDKFKDISSRIQGMSGEDLRKIEEILDEIQ